MIHHKVIFVTCVSTDMKRKFDETCIGSYTEARNLVFNLSLGKLHSCSPKPVEPSLWRSLLIVKILHRIAEELKVEASVAEDEAMTTDKVVEEEVVDAQRLDASFLLPSPPAITTLLSKSKDEASSDNCTMQTDDDDGERSSSLALGTSALNLNVAGARMNLDAVDHVAACINNQGSSVDGTFTEALLVRDCFDEIDCACQECFQVDDLSDVVISLDQEFLFGSQMPLSCSAFSSTCEDSQSFAGISELDCLMQTLEEECV